MRQHRILVCGGRDFGVDPPPWEHNHQAVADRAFLTKYLNEIKDKCIVECIIQGGAKGADQLAGLWADYHKIPNLEFRADWDKYGKRAGFIRNQQMLDEAKPTLTIAFPGGTGTADMIRRSKAAGIPVLEIA